MAGELERICERTRFEDKNEKLVRVRLLEVLPSRSEMENMMKTNQ